jgi:hypothetical protein
LRRLKEYGRNGVEAVAPERLWLRLMLEFGSFFSLILWLAAGLAFFAAWRNPAWNARWRPCAGCFRCRPK